MGYCGILYTFKDLIKIYVNHTSIKMEENLLPINRQRDGWMAVPQCTQFFSPENGTTPETKDFPGGSSG